MEIRVNLKNVDKVLGMLTKDIDLETILQDNSKKVKSEAKRLCPVDTGRLQNSINSSTIRTGINSFESSVFTNIPYAPYVEFGTGRRGDGSYPYETDLDFNYGENAGQTAQPYLYPALQNCIEELIEKIKEKL